MATDSGWIQLLYRATFITRRITPCCGTSYAWSRAWSAACAKRFRSHFRLRLVARGHRRAQDAAGPLPAGGCQSARDGEARALESSHVPLSEGGMRVVIKLV